MGDCKKVGPPLVRCTECGKRKCPLGRDPGMVAADSYCDWNGCEGYWQDPKPSQMWPGEECDPITCTHQRRPHAD